MNEKDHSPSDQPRPRRLYQFVTVHRLRQIDQALRIVNGSFVLGARLVGMDPVKFKNTVNAHQSLKAKWGHKKTGRPRGRATLHKLVFDATDAIPRDARSCAGQCVALFERLPWREQRRVHDLLKIKMFSGLADSLHLVRMKWARDSIKLLRQFQRDAGKVRPES